MDKIGAMIDTHPTGTAVDKALLEACIAACFECAATCSACADACLGEPEVDTLVGCIRLNLDCADICGATGRVLVRLTRPNNAVLLAQLRACAEACRGCGEECERHAEHHDHCAECARACRGCAEACEKLIDALGVAPESIH